MQKISLEVNGRKVSREIEDSTLLSTLLRENLNLTGTHIGCDTSQCGTCVVHVDGESVKSCTLFAADINGSKVTTIEGLANNGKLHPMQEAFKKKPSDQEIRDWLEGNICRCTGYQNIVAAVKEAASKM